jgi:transcription elongation factor Elf1
MDYSKLQLGDKVGNNGFIFVEHMRHVIQPSGQKRARAKFICPVCGEIKETNILSVVRNDVTSCGCVSRERTRQASTTHGLSRHPLYKAWSDMKYRCYNSKDTYYKIYGGKGVRVCDEWKDSFITYYNWCIDNGWEKCKQIDRIDPDGNYEPTNCRIVEVKVNCQNKGKFRNNTSGYKGVTVDSKSGKYMARIMDSECSYYLGMYKNIEDAAMAYDVAIKKLKTHHRPSFPSLDIEDIPSYIVDKVADQIQKCQLKNKKEKAK